MKPKLIDFERLMAAWAQNDEDEDGDGDEDKDEDKDENEDEDEAEDNDNDRCASFLHPLSLPPLDLLIALRAVLSVCIHVCPTPSRGPGFGNCVCYVFFV